MESKSDQSEKHGVLAYATPPPVPLRPTVGRYISASIRGAVMFVLTLFLMAMLTGQAFDAIRGWQNLVLAIGIYAIPTAVAISSFRASIRHRERGANVTGHE